MKRLLSILFAAVLLLPILAQTPDKMSYQAVIRDANNESVKNKPVGVKISILKGTETGIAVYEQTYLSTTNSNGLISLEIGGSLDFRNINWADGIYFVKTETDPAGGTNYAISGTSQLLTVPYALHAKTAENITGTISETDPVFSVSAAMNITDMHITNLNNLSGTNTGDQDLSALATKAALVDSAANIRSTVFVAPTVWLKGKKVLWLGTSIPESGQYPTRSCEALGATCTNQALGASFARFGERNPTNPIAGDWSDIHRLHGLSQTIAEKEATWGDICTADQLEIARNASFERKLLPYLSGDNKVDLVVIDHGFNDRGDVIGTADDIATLNRDTFYGAMAYLIDQIRREDFRTKIAIATHYDNTMEIFGAAEIVDAQEDLGEKLGVIVLPSYKLTGLSKVWVPGTSNLYPEVYKYDPDPNTGDLTLVQCWFPDGFHPHSDGSGRAQVMLTNVYIQLLKDI
ncbi:hypothetical protein [Viscerimonas tarda]